MVVASIALGFAFGRWSNTTEPAALEPAARPTGPTKRVVHSAGQASPDDSNRIGALERELALERMRSANLEVVAYGRAPTWPEEVLPGHSPEAFRAFVRQAVTACGVDVDIAGFDCDEPPCMAIVRGGGPTWFSDLTNCGLWADMYGTKGGSLSQQSARCADGTNEQFTLVGPPNGDYLRDQAETDPLIFVKRVTYRADQIQFDYVCQGHEPQAQQ